MFEQPTVHHFLNLQLPAGEKVAAAVFLNGAVLVITDYGTVLRIDPGSY